MSFNKVLLRNTLIFYPAFLLNVTWLIGFCGSFQVWSHPSIFVCPCYWVKYLRVSFVMILWVTETYRFSSIKFLSRFASASVEVQYNYEESSCCLSLMQNPKGISLKLSYLYEKDTTIISDSKQRMMTLQDRMKIVRTERNNNLRGRYVRLQTFFLYLSNPIPSCGSIMTWSFV